MKVRGSKVLLCVIFVFILSCAFALTALAEDITLTFKNGEEVVKTQTVGAGTKVEMPNEELDGGKSVNWHTDDGRGYSGGDMVAFTEDTTLYRKDVYDVSTFNELKGKLENGDDVRLVADIVGNDKISPRGEHYLPIVFLNGHSIKIGTEKRMSTAWGGHRCGTKFYGAGLVEFIGQGDPGSTYFAEMKSHTWGGDKNQYFIGRDAILNVPNSYIGYDSEGSFSLPGYPLITVYGKLNCYGFYDMMSNLNKEAKVVIHKGAEVIINGPIMKHSVLGNTVYMEIYGGTITTTNINASASFFADNAYTSFKIEGGVFSFKFSKDYDKLKEKINSNTFTTLEIQTNSTKYAAVCGKDCTHRVKLASKTDASCYHPIDELYMCEICLEEYLITYGERIDHVKVELDKKDATHKELGWIKYGCETCWHITYEDIGTDPNKAPITVKVRLDNGQVIDVNTTLEKVFVIVSDESHINNEITQILDFGEYKASQLLEFTIPVGITALNIPDTSAVDGVEVINFTEVMGRLIEIKSLKGFTSLKTINIGNVNIQFNAGSIPDTIQCLNTVEGGGTVTFAENSFKDKASLTSFVTKSGTSYEFGKNSFYNTGFTELYFADGATLIFSGEAAFGSCASLKTIYVGKGIKQLNRKPFEQCYKLERVVLMDVYELSENVFSAGTDDKAATSELLVYSHSNQDMTSFEKAFSNRNDKKVYLYALSSNIESLSDCKYEIHHGIPHRYEYTQIPPSCSQQGIKGYITDCICGDNKGAIYKLYKSDVSGYEIVTLLNESIPTLPHKFEASGKVEYKGGFDSTGLLTYKCKDCTALDEENKRVLPPLTRFPGYSVNEQGAKGIAIRYFVDSNVIDYYKELGKNNIEYGIVLATYAQLNGKAPLNSDGTAREGVLKYNMSSAKQYDVAFRLTGLSDAQLSTGFVISGYIIIDGSIIYVQSSIKTDSPDYITYNSIVGSTVALAPVSKKEY